MSRRPGPSAALGAGRRLSRRDGLRALAALGLLCGPAGPAVGAALVAVRIWPAPDYTRITLESDVALVARHQMRDPPPRLVVDLDDLELTETLRDLVGKVRADDPFIAGLRVTPGPGGGARLLIDLKQAIEPQVFALSPVAAYRHRLVFDLYAAQARDPLLALIREKVQADRAAGEVRDALGEFIGRLDRERPGSTPARPADPAVATPAPLPAELQQRIDRLVVVAIDPGHGGEDPGAIGPTGLREKDVVLDVARRLRERLNEQPGMRAFMTRDGDYFVPLRERVRKARRVQADLLVSVHADAFYTPRARGASVFALSDGGATSEAARWMAERENAADAVGGVNLRHADASVLRTMLDMSTTAQIKDSLKVGQEVLTRLGSVGRLHKRQVEQAGFAVLKAPDIPSILVETAFISNPEEEARLREPKYRTQLVEALATGIKRYFARNPPLARTRRI